MTVYVLILRDKLFKDSLQGAGGLRTFTNLTKAERAGRRWVKKQYKKPTAIEGRSYEYEVYRTRLQGGRFL